MSKKTTSARPASSLAEELDREAEEFDGEEIASVPALPDAAGPPIRQAAPAVEVVLSLPPLPEAPSSRAGYADVVPQKLQVKFAVHRDDSLRRTLRNLRRRLNASSVRLANGKHVETQADAIRWALERFQEAGV